MPEGKKLRRCKFEMCKRILRDSEVVCHSCGAHNELEQHGEAIQETHITHGTQVKTYNSKQLNEPSFLMGLEKIELVGLLVSVNSVNTDMAAELAQKKKITSENAQKAGEAVAADFTKILKTVEQVYGALIIITLYCIVSGGIFALWLIGKLFT